MFASPHKRKKLFLWMLMVSSALAFAMVLFFILTIKQVFGPVPSSTILRSIENYDASEILARGGEQLGRYFLYDRTSVNLVEVSPYVTDALIATEDVRFYNHKGIDIRSIGRVAVKNLIMRQRSAGGGSTITLQLAKNLYPRSGGNSLSLLADKLREAIIARRLEKIYSKEEILILYLNTVSFGDNVYGISAASNRFFNKHPSALNPEESAMLVGMLKATHRYNPRLYPERSLLRRNTVIGQMRNYKYISEQMADSLMGLPIILDYKPVSHIHGPAPYFRERLRQDLLVFLEDYNTSNETEYNLYTDGLIIQTSIDYDLQTMAEQTMRSRLQQLQHEADRHYRGVSKVRAQSLLDQLMNRSNRYEELRRQGLSDAEIRTAFSENIDLVIFNGSDESVVTMSLMDSVFHSQKLLHGAILSLEPETGLVRAWVGGVNFRYFQFDNVLSSRQTASSFKPFVYAAALEAGMGPCDYVSNEPIVFDDYDGWSPVNANGNYEGFYSMKGALSNSINTVTTRILKNTGYEPLFRIMRRSGLPHEVQRIPSLALGTIEINLLAMTAAYGIFVNQGVAMPPVYLLRVEDAEGNTLFDARPEEPPAPAISQTTALLVTEMLTGVTQNGTARMLGHRFDGITDIAGKTGTAQFNSDGWFVGFTPELITGVWVGIENPAFASIYPLPFGASHSAASVWGDFMLEAYRYDTTRDWVAGSFDSLSQEMKDVLNCPDYLLELPRISWFERIFGKPEVKEVEPTDTLDKRPRRRGLFRRIFDEIF